MGKLEVLLLPVLCTPSLFPYHLKWKICFLKFSHFLWDLDDKQSICSEQGIFLIQLLVIYNLHLHVDTIQTKSFWNNVMYNSEYTRVAKETEKCEEDHSISLWASQNFYSNIYSGQKNQNIEIWGCKGSASFGIYWSVSNIPLLSVTFSMWLMKNQPLLSNTTLEEMWDSDAGTQVSSAILDILASLSYLDSPS